MNLQRGKQLPALVVYLPCIEAVTVRMPPVALYRAVGPAGKRGSKLRRAGEISANTPGLDLAMRLRVFQRALRSRIERRDALVDIVRAVNATLEPAKIGEILV